jgi:hypothetical protein
MRSARVSIAITNGMRSVAKLNTVELMGSAKRAKRLVTLFIIIAPRSVSGVVRCGVVCVVLSGDFRGFPGISGDFRRFPGISGDLRWFPGISGDFRWFPGISGDFRGFPVICGDLRWFAVICGDLRGFAVISGDLRGFAGTETETETETETHDPKNHPNPK